MAAPDDLTLIDGEGPVPARKAAESVATNYGIYWRIRTRLELLQEWVREQQRVNPE